jgi:hypothetical protein
MEKKIFTSIRNFSTGLYFCKKYIASTSKISKTEKIIGIKFFIEKDKKNAQVKN